MASIDLLVSTMNFYPGKLDKLLVTVPDYVNIIIVNQVTNGVLPDQVLHIKPNVLCYSFTEKGLSKSRNRLIELSAGDILVITDDDIEFIPNAFDKIISAFAEYSDEDILTFAMLKPDGQPRKNYRENFFQHDQFSIAKVSSCEIAVKRSSIHSANIKYDEMFGLGAVFPIGEEVIFLRDCLRKSLKIGFVPIYISIHPEDSSGRAFTTDSEFSRGALFYRVYGLLSFFIGVAFYIRKRPILANTIGFFGALHAYYRGIYEYKAHF